MALETGVLKVGAETVSVVDITVGTIAVTTFVPLSRFVAAEAALKSSCKFNQRTSCLTRLFAFSKLYDTIWRLSGPHLRFSLPEATWPQQGSGFQ